MKSFQKEYRKASKAVNKIFGKPLKAVGNSPEAAALYTLSIFVSALGTLDGFMSHLICPEVQRDKIIGQIHDLKGEIEKLMNPS